jgi:putative DNA primase/helicase
MRNTLDIILSKLSGVRRSGTGYIARCPAHDDRHPSLKIDQSNGKILLHCFAGCRVEDIVSALGMEMGDLFEDSDGQQHRDVSLDGEFTDRNNAQILAQELKDDVKYVPQWGWVYWDGSRWKRDAEGNVVKLLAREKLPQHYLKKALENSEKRKVYAQYAVKAHARAKVENALELSKGELLSSPEAFDANPWWLCVGNGVIDLRRQIVMPHMREMNLTLWTPVEYRPGAKAPMFEQFLREIFLEDDELISYVKRALGYSITGDTSENKIFICYGSGANGKSTLLQTIRHVLGEYAVAVPSEVLVKKKYDVHPTALAHLAGKRFALASETDEMAALNEARVKAMTGRDTISARFLHKDYFDFEITAKVWLATNHKPVIKDTSEAMWRRIAMIPFNAFFPPEQQDKHLLEKLKAEAEGILAWLVEGCYEWQERGLDEPDIVRNAVLEYRSEMDILQGWLEECCEIAPGTRTLIKDLYASYCQYCEDNGIVPVSVRTFSTKMDEKGFITVVGTDNKKFKKGIALRNNMPEMA